MTITPLEFGVGGGGGGLTFREPADEFTGANLAACRTARNTFFATTAGLAALPEYQRTQYLAIILNPTNSVDNVFESYLPGNEGMAYDPAQWVDRTDAVEGNQGPQGRFPIAIHTNDTTTPTTPVGGSYIVETGVLTPPAGWTILTTTPGVGEDIYTSEAIINPEVDTGSVIPTWSVPIERTHLSGGGITHVNTDMVTVEGDGVGNPIEVIGPFTADEKVKLGRLEIPVDLGNAPVQDMQTFTYAAPTGWTPGGFSANGQLIYLGIGAVVNPDESDVIISIGTDFFNLHELGGRRVQLHELIDDSQYLAFGRNQTLTLIGLSAEVVDITDTSLPSPDDDAFGKVYLDRLTPAAFMVHETRTASSPAMGDVDNFADGNFLGFGLDDSAYPLSGSGDVGNYYWQTSQHRFRRWTENRIVESDPLTWVYLYNTIHNVGFELGGADGYWVGWSENLAEFLSKIPLPFDSTLQYFGVIVHETTPGAIRFRELHNTAFVPPVNPTSITEWVTLGLYGNTSGGQTAAQVQAAIASAIAALRDGVPTNRDTLNELNDAIDALQAALANSGATFRIGAGVPANALGSDRDTYLDSDTGTFYLRDAGTYANQYTDQVGTAGLDTTQVNALIAAAALLKAQNLADLDNVGIARTNLGVLSQSEVDARADVRAAVRYTDAEQTKLADIEVEAKDDQTGLEIVALLNTALGSMTWQEGGGMGGMSDGTLTMVEFADDGQVTFTSSAGTPIITSMASAVNALIALALVSYATRTYVAGAFDNVSYDGPSRELVFEALDSTQDQSLSLDFIGQFHGVGGDTFLTAQTFYFGDSCIVDGIYYFYTFRTSGSFGPVTVPFSGRYVRIPVLESGVLRTDQIAAGGNDDDVVTRTPTGHAWMPQASPALNPAGVKTAYESNLDTNAFTDDDQSKLADIEERATTDQTPTEIKSDYEGNADTNALTDALLAKLNTIPADAASASMVIVDITQTGLPTADANAKNHIWVNYEIPTVYIIHEFLEGGTPPTGTFNDFTNSLFNGEWPSSTEAIVGNGGPFAIGEWYWNTTDRQAYRYDQVSSINRLFVHVSMDTLLGTGYIWLQHGEFRSELLIRIDEFDSATIYVGEVGGNLIQLDNTTYVGGVNEHTSYNWELIGGLGSGTGIGQDLVNNLIFAAFASAVQGNTETGITVTYDATDNTFDFVVTGGMAGGGGVYYPIDASNVGGTRNDVTLSTTQSLAVYVHGMMVFFEQGSNFNTGAMTLDVDGLGPVAFRRSDGAGGREEFPLRGISGGELVIAVYDSDADVFSWAGGTLGSASARNIGELEGTVALLGTGGRFIRGRLPSEIAYEDGATFTGPVLGPTPTVNGHLTTKQYVDNVAQSLASRYYPIGLAGVGGTINAITLTTGLSLSAYFHGMAVYFVATSGDNTGNVTINVDGIGSRPFLQANQHGFAQFQSGGITSGTPLLAIYDEQGNRFLWAGGAIGAAATRLVGSASGNVVGVGSNNRIDESLLPTDLARTSGATFTGPVLGPDPTADAHLATKEYVDTSAGGVGDITNIETNADSGLQGGADSGDVTLQLDFDSLGSFVSTQLSLTDIFVVRDESTNTVPYRSIRKDELAIALITGNTLAVTSGNIHVRSGGIDTAQLAGDAVTEPKLSMGNSPSLDQVIGWDGSGNAVGRPGGDGSERIPILPN